MIMPSVARIRLSVLFFVLWLVMADGPTAAPVAAAPSTAGGKWIPITMAGAPGPRYSQTAVWTGNEMIIWGGGGPADNEGEDWVSLGDGARYNPGKATWTPLPTTAAPAPRVLHTSVW